MLQHGVHTCEDGLHLVVYVHQILHLLVRQTLVIVVYVLEAGTRYVQQRLGYLTHVVDHLHVVLRRVHLVLLHAREHGHETVFPLARRLV